MALFINKRECIFLPIAKNGARLSLATSPRVKDLFISNSIINLILGSPSVPGARQGAGSRGHWRGQRVGTGTVWVGDTLGPPQCRGTWIWGRGMCPHALCPRRASCTRSASRAVLGARLRTVGNALGRSLLAAVSPSLLFIFYFPGSSGAAGSVRCRS